jgi:ribosomal protein S18 acetylase RimI-like enzyme
MEFRKTDKTDINEIMGIIQQAQAYFKANGIDQWQNNYPNAETIGNDVSNGNSYVLLKDNQVVATAAIIFDKDITYDNIYEGQWLSDNQYVVIHRIAVSNSYKGLGLGNEIIKKVEQLCANNGVRSIRIDTHGQNLSMQRLLKKNDFQHCGIIYLQDGNKRIAFEKILKSY